MSLSIRPIRQRDALQFVRDVHRHNKPPAGSIFQVAVYEADEIRGVAIAGRPVSRHLDDGRTLEVTRVCTDGARNACSMLYGACRRAGTALGYTRGVTYKRADDPGTSLAAANMRKLWDVAAQPWSRLHRPRNDDHDVTPREAWGWGEWT